MEDLNYLILVRHGQSEWNAKNLFTGWKDPDLTNQGRNEAEKDCDCVITTGLHGSGKNTLVEIIKLKIRKLKGLT